MLLKNDNAKKFFVKMMDEIAKTRDEKERKAKKRIAEQLLDDYRCFSGEKFSFP